jgi:hypothetical protein
MGEAEPSGRLDDRVLATLQQLPGEIAFSGLRRVLGAHPESLTRSLRRLEREGLVVRAHGAYRALTPSGGGSGADPADARLRPVAEVELPSHLPPQVLVERLASRWFGSLRWVGFVDRRDERLMAWASRSGGGIVLLGTHAGRLRVLVPSGLGQPDPAEAEEAAYELLYHAVDALRGLGARLASDAPTGLLLLSGVGPWSPAAS